MGFAKPDLTQARQQIQKALGEISSPRNDGFTSSHCKHELFLLKCWLEDQYNALPTFTGENQWEQERLVQILKK